MLRLRISIVSLKLSVRMPVFMSRSKLLMAGETESLLKMPTCCALLLVISTTGLAFMSSTVALVIEMKVLFKFSARPRILLR